MNGFSFLSLAVIIIVLLLVFSAFFSSSEIAIFSLDAKWIEDKRLEGIKNADVLSDLRNDSHKLLVTILVGNNIVNIAISSITTVVLVAYLPKGQAVTLATIIASFFILIFGEIIPKSYGISNAKEWSLITAKPIKWIEKILYPLVIVFDFITRKISIIIGGETSIEKQYIEE